MKILRDIGYYAVYAFVVVALLLVALFAPEKYVKYKEQHILEQVNRKTIEMDTYQLTFHNFAEKLYTYGNAKWRGIDIEMIQIPDNEQEISNEELTGYVDKEVDILLEDMWDKAIPITAGELKNRELYMLYGNQDKGNRNALAGMYVYRLVYVTNWLSYDNVELEFYLDAEFHKIYWFSVTTLYSNVRPEEKEELLDRVMGAKKTTLSEVLPQDIMSEYWGLADSYIVEPSYGEEFIWDEKKSWGRGGFDKVFLGEKEEFPDMESRIDVWRYLLYEELGRGFHIEMGVYPEDKKDEEYLEMKQY